VLRLDNILTSLLFLYHYIPGEKAKSLFTLPNVLIVTSITLGVAAVSYCTLLLWKSRKESPEKIADLENIPLEPIVDASKKGSQKEKTKENHTMTINPFPLPSHRVLQKDDALKEQAQELAGRKEELTKEFEDLVEYVSQQVNKTSSVARQEENKPHNRYLDNGRKPGSSVV
jgi:hypothetical protein